MGMGLDNWGSDELGVPMSFEERGDNERALKSRALMCVLINVGVDGWGVERRGS